MCCLHRWSFTGFSGSGFNGEAGGYNLLHGYHRLVKVNSKEILSLLFVAGDLTLLWEYKVPTPLK